MIRTTLAAAVLAVITLTAPAAHATDHRPGGGFTYSRPDGVPPAHDRDPGDPHAPCVTGHEWGQLRGGMTPRQVVAILDGPGIYHPSNHPKRFWRRDYRICGFGWRHARVFLWFNRDTDHLSEGFWLEVGPNAVIVDESGRTKA